MWCARAGARLGRRAFLKGTSLLLTSSAWNAALSMESERAADLALRIGVVTDLHYADKPPAGTRHYRETLGKLAEAAERFRREDPAFVVELGDLIDAAESVAAERRYLTTVNREFAAIGDDRHYVLGNHCVDTLTKDEFLDGVEQERSYYSFDRSGFHFVVLDACFRSDGEPYGRRNFHWTDSNVPPAEIEWLQADLKRADAKAIVFAHQRLDVNNNHGVKNAREVRKVLERSGRVLAAFQGHSHQNDYRQIGGIHYCTLAAVVEGSGAENNGYALLDLFADGTIGVRGFRRQESYRWEARD